MPTKKAPAAPVKRPAKKASPVKALNPKPTFHVRVTQDQHLKLARIAASYGLGVDEVLGRVIDRLSERHERPITPNPKPSNAQIAREMAQRSEVRKAEANRR